ncbi:MAG: Acyl-[acyl-carrier-protein]--UDP-N-acetylglucosamine O-acyltransferase [Chthoniobacteraceae bacterium]|nr:Acyl-[acyl-carrier-protein]--UDP-N-acetylglucosamine O-acyltransferase [Chthoniobacteraceae bacterium]
MTSKIHPTAVVDPGAQIGENVVIGPYCVIEEKVIIGDGCWFQNHVTVCGPTKIGPGNRFFSFGSIGQVTQDLKYAGEPTHLEIGENNVFREFVTLHRGTAPGSVTRIGSHCYLLSYSHVAHDCVVGDHVIFSNNGTLAGHVEVGDYAVIGGLTAIHQFCRIGAHALTGGCSKIVQDVPPYMIADGNPAKVRSFNKVGLERHGFSEEAIRRIKEAYRLIYRSKLNLQQAVEQIRVDLADSPELELLIEFVTNSPRGIIR